MGSNENFEFFQGMLLHSSVAMETCFGKLGLYPENYLYVVVTFHEKIPNFSY